MITKLNHWIKIKESLLNDGIYFVFDEHTLEYCLTTKTEILAYSNLLPTSEGLIFDKIVGSGYGLLMHKIVLMSQYPLFIRPSRSSKTQVVNIWQKLNSICISKPTETIWNTYDNSIITNSIDRIELLNKEYSLEPSNEFNKLVRVSNEFIEKMSLLVPNYTEKRLKKGRELYTLEYI
jgi:hypothetical protein